MCMVATGRGWVQGRAGRRSRGRRVRCGVASRGTTWRASVSPTHAGVSGADGVAASPAALAWFSDRFRPNRFARRKSRCCAARWRRGIMGNGSPSGPSWGYDGGRVQGR